jgi:hypothetical protein
MTGYRLTLHYHKGTHRNIPVRACGICRRRQYADFAVLWGRMPNQLVLPRLDGECVSTEQKIAVRRRQEFPDNPNAGFRLQVATVSYLVGVTFLTFSSLMFIFARESGLPRIRDQFGRIGAPNSAVDVVRGMVNWPYVCARPKKVKENRVIAKAAEEVERETTPHHGDRRLTRELRGSTDCRRRIAVR